MADLTINQLQVASPGTPALNDNMAADTIANVSVGYNLQAVLNLFTATAPYLPYTEVSSSQAMINNHRYTTNNASLVVLTLPATAPIGSVLMIYGKGAGGWQVAQNSGQTIHFGIDNTTTGAGGSLSSTNTFDNVTLTCITANTDWIVSSPSGNLTYV